MSTQTTLGADDNLVSGTARRLGDREIGPLGFGCWRLVGTDTQAATHLISHALDIGMTLIDNADVYGLDWGGQAFGENETLLGTVLAQTPSLRDKMVLASKGSILPGVPYVANAPYLNAACDASLTRLQSAHIDLYQIHRPDMFTHPAETAAALDGLVSAGKISMVGVSNYTIAQIRALQAHLKAPLVSVQNQFSVVDLSMLRDGTLDLCMESNITPLAWSPLAGGAQRLNAGSALKFCDLVGGDCDVYPRTSPCYEWDLAAGDALVRAAGGRVTTLEGADIRYNQWDSLKAPKFVAAADPSVDYAPLVREQDV